MVANQVDPKISSLFLCLHFFATGIGYRTPSMTFCAISPNPPYLGSGADCPVNRDFGPILGIGARRRSTSLVWRLLRVDRGRGKMLWITFARIIRTEMTAR